MYNLYPSLNLSYTHQEYSYLYSVSPLFINTGLVESLTGYIARLAETHCVYSGILTERIIAPVIKKKYSSANLHKIYQYTGALNGTGLMANDIILALEKLTKQKNLASLTFNKWAEILPTRYLLHHYRTWCPLCYQEWKQQNHLIYEPLIWTLKLVKVCPIHNIPLQQKCPHCHQANFILSWKSRPGYCSRCEQWLGYSQSKSSTHLFLDINGETNLASDGRMSNLLDINCSSDLDWHIWVARNIQNLLSSTLDTSLINLSNSLTQIAEQLTDGNIAALARYLKMPKNTVWLWCKGRNKPSLEALLMISYRLKINLVDLLANKKSYSVSLKVPLVPYPIVSTSRKAPTFDASYAHQELTKVLNNSESPPLSLEEVAKQISCDRRTLYRHFPELCRQISSRYLSYRQICYQQSVSQCCQEVEQAVITLYQQGAYPTEDLVSQLISHPGYFRYKRVRKVFQEAKERLSHPQL